LGVKTAKAGTVGAAVSGGALFFLLCSVGEWRKIYLSRVAASSTTFLFLISNQILSHVFLRRN
jgi:hypothetical protein